MASTVVADARPAPYASGYVGRGVFVAVLAVLLLLPATTLDFANFCSLAAIYGVIGISLNIIIGYTGQLSLGHQGFLGVGSLVAANLVTAKQLPFAVGLGGGALAGAGVALLLGLVALRITGLYLALITLVFGLTVASSLFQLGSLTNNGSGLPANRPDLVASNGRYYLLCLAVLVVVFLLDVRLTRTKTGRALLALKENERVAEAFGIDVTVYKLIAFALAGAVVGLAGGLYVFRSQQFSGQNFQGQTGLNLALLFVVMVTVGGLGNRVGVVVASAFFALIDYLLDKVFMAGPLMHVAKHVPVINGYYGQNKGALAGLIGAGLLLQTLIFNPGGLGAQLRPLSRWLSGEPFSLHDDDADSGPAAVEGSSVRA
ncbi:MAG: leucine/isoleucine/valine transporter permease subunit [Frankiales bacterium]|nr:leucine/isoleucine/valine transporter permease subunit [Frankiales bacterium]